MNIIFDTHSDTPFDMFREGFGLDNDRAAVSLGSVARYDKKFFVSAFYSDKDKNGEECYIEFIKSSFYYDLCIDDADDRAMLCKCPEDMRQCFENGKFGAIKAVEGAKLLCKDASRLTELYRHGVRLILPLWGGSDSIGGAWDTDDGLTEFGRTVVEECNRLGIVVDVSHMSTQSFWDTASISTRPIVASHSNLKSVCSHRRNLDDEQMKHIISCKGIIGLNLCNAHVSDKYSSRLATPEDDFIRDALAHTYYLLENGGEKTACLGCDWDGTKLPPQIPDVSYMYRLYEAMLKDGIPESTVCDVFFNNAYSFFINNI